MEKCTFSNLTKTNLNTITQIINYNFPIRFTFLFNLGKPLLNK